MREILILNIPSIFFTNYLEVPSETQLFSKLAYWKRPDIIFQKKKISSATLLTIFGGRVFDIKSFLIDERIPDGWESRARNRWGLTIFKFNWTTIPLELSINEKKYRAKRALQKAETSQEALNPPQLWNICTTITISSTTTSESTLTTGFSTPIQILFASIFISLTTFHVYVSR